MPIFQNDHFISSSYQTAIFFSTAGALFYGFLADKLGISWAFIIFSVLDCLGKIFLPFCLDKTPFLVAIILVGFHEKSILVLFGTALNHLYGLDSATELLPFKGLSIFMGLILSPGLSIILSKWINSHEFLKALGFLNLLIIVFAVLFRKIYEEKVQWRGIE